MGLTVLLKNVTVYNITVEFIITKYERLEKYILICLCPMCPIADVEKYLVYMLQDQLQVQTNQIFNYYFRLIKTILLQLLYYVS